MLPSKPFERESISPWASGYMHEFILETEARRTNSYFSRLPMDIIEYMKPFVSYAITPRVRFANDTDPLITESVAYKRTLRSSTFCKIMGWSDDRLDVSFLERVHYYSTYENERGVRFIFREMEAAQLAYVNMLMRVSARSVEALMARISIYISWWDKARNQTYVDIRVKPPNGLKEWPDRELILANERKRALLVRSLTKKNGPPQKKFMAKFSFKM